MSFINTWAYPKTLAFGKYDGYALSASEVETSYLHWMTKKLPLDTYEIHAVVAELHRRGALEDGDSRFRYQAPPWEEDAPPASVKLPVVVTQATVLEVVSAGRQTLAKRYHPDTSSGSHEKMLAVNVAADYLEAQAQQMGWSR